jgi:2-phosphosulfolactate phosphatase
MDFTQPQIHFATNDDCHTHSGVVVPVDVCRAFTTAAYAFGAGAERIYLVSTPEEALALRDRFPGALVMGEVNGRPAPGFDMGNSPEQVRRLDLSGKTLIQRTSAGTQGVVRATAAEHIYASSFAVAEATVRAVQKHQPASVTFVITGKYPGQPRWGEEDAACAEYQAALLRDQQPDPSNFMDWMDVYIEERLDEMDEDFRSVFSVDLELCRKVDAFPFALRVRRGDGLLVMEKEIV